MKITLEVCADSVRSCLAAERGGAHRIELCAGLTDGGITPSYGFVLDAVTRCHLPIFPIIRPRGGDFLYDEYEFSQMEEDIKQLRNIGVAGFVFGILTPDGRLDRDRNTHLLGLAKGMPCTLHRAFDMTRDMDEALGDAIDLGFSRILTSGGAPDALTGAGRLRELVKSADDRITIMAGSGVRPENAASIVSASGVSSLHGTLSRTIDGGMTFRNTAVCMGGETDEYALRVTDEELVRTLLDHFA